MQITSKALFQTGSSRKKQQDETQSAAKLAASADRKVTVTRAHSFL